MSRFPKWTQEEKDRLTELYKTLPAYEICKILGRPLQGTILMAGRLGLKADRTIHWTGTWRFLNGNNPYESIPKDKIAYLAGIIDGEGSLDRDKRGFWRLTVGNTYKPLVEWLTTTIEYSMHNFRKRARPTWKDSWVWHLHGNRKVLALLKIMQPYLIVKRDKAITAINEIEVQLANV